MISLSSMAVVNVRDAVTEAALIIGCKAVACQVRLWPAWKCVKYPCIGSHPGTPTPVQDMLDNGWEEVRARLRFYIPTLLSLLI